jgi:hypothetical protein
MRKIGLEDGGGGSNPLFSTWDAIVIMQEISRHK